MFLTPCLIELRFLKKTIMMSITILMLMLARCSIADEALGQLSGSHQESVSKVCESSSVKTCQDLSVKNLRVIKNEAMEFPGVETLYSQENQIGDSYQFTSEAGSYAIFTADEKSSSIFGFLNTKDGRHFIIEKSEIDHVLIESDAKLFEDEIVLKNTTSNSLLVNPFLFWTTERTEMIPVRVKFYFTSEFSRQTVNVDLYVKALVEITNKGFINSGANMRIVKHTVEKSDIVESKDVKTNTEKLLQHFLQSKPIVELLDGHDIAILLFPAYKECKTDPEAKCNCGATYMSNSVRAMENVGLVRKDCGVGQYSLGHVLGKMFGGGDFKQYGRWNGVFGYASLFEGNDGCLESRTILANSRKLPGCEEPPRLNGYSAPDVCRRDLVVGPCDVVDTGLQTGRGYHEIRLGTLRSFIRTYVSVFLSK